MLLLKALTFSLIFCVAKSAEDMCINNFTDTDYKPINFTSYCENRLCITKCCPVGEILNENGTCEDRSELEEFKSKLNFTNVTLPSWEGEKPSESRESLFDFVVLQNLIVDNEDCYTEHQVDDVFYIVEDGTAMMYQENSVELWGPVTTDKYCIDYKIDTIEDDNTTTPTLQIVVKEKYDDNGNDTEKRIFLLIALPISSFFLLLVLIGYSLLPDLHNLPGLMLMSYVASLFCTNVLRVVLVAIIADLDFESCQIFSPFIYFFIISSFLWLNIMAFDLWWSIRSFRKSHMHRHSERIKFLQYCLCAWGVALLVTVATTIVDNIDLTDYPRFIRPPFGICLSEDQPVLYYITIPIVIVAVVNIVLFTMTVYNIQMTKKMLNSKNKDSRISKQETPRFILYIKLSLLMGVIWIMEVVPEPKSLYLYMLVNLHNCGLGVIIFFFFVFNKENLKKLCKKFNIKCGFVDKMAFRTETTKSTYLSSFKKEESESQSQVEDTAI